MARIQSNDALKIDGETIAYVSNTLKTSDGKPKVEILVASKGGGAVERTTSVDDSTDIMKASFELYSTPENSLRVAKWINNVRNNVGVVIEVGGNFNAKNMFFVNELEVDRKTGGTIKIEFEGGA